MLLTTLISRTVSSADFETAIAPLREIDGRLRTLRDLQ